MRRPILHNKIKVILVLAAALLIAAENLGCGCLCFGPSCEASTAELSEAAKYCYAMQHSAYNVHAYDQYTVKDLKVLSRMMGGSQMEVWTVWTVEAKLYTPENQYVADIKVKAVKMARGWNCLP